jgi:hypothetical protein
MQQRYDNILIICFSSVCFKTQFRLHLSSTRINPGVIHRKYNFRTLKTDLDLRPIYHKKDASTMAHLPFGLLIYQAVNTVRYQFKQKKAEMDTQTQVENTDDQTNITPVINSQ